MATTHSTMPVFPTQKRSACDRCRAQKLRCPPRKRSTDPCGRCLRTKSRCVTGYPKQGGRPMNDASSQQFSSAKPSAHSSASKTMRQPSTSVFSVVKEPEYTTKEQSQAASMLSPESIGLGPAEWDNNDSSGLLEGFLSPSLGFPGQDNNTPAAFSFDPDVCTEDSNLFFDETAFLTPESIALDSFASPQLSAESSAPICHSSSPESNTGAEFPASDAAPVGEKYINVQQRLLNLNLDIASQLQSYPDVSSATANLHLPSAFDRTDLQSHCDSMLADAVNDATEFIAILQCLHPAGQMAEGGEGLSPKKSMPRREPDSIVILNVLSVHMQLMALYQKLFQTLDMMLNGQPSIPAFQQSASNPRSVSLQAQIIMHAVLRQSEIIDGLLGLPMSLCVTSSPRKHSDPGILDYARGKAVLDAVFGAGNALESSAECKTLSSLREVLRKVQQSLDV